MKKYLIMIDDKFHNNEGMTFSTKEITFFKDFDKIILLSTHSNILDDAFINDDRIVFLYCPNPTKKDYAINILKSFLRNAIYKDIVKLIKNKKLSKANLRNLLRFLMMTEYLYSNFNKQLSNLHLEPDSHILIYSYWLHYHAALGIRLKKLFKNVVLISRAHRYDLYEYRSNGYLPLREFILSNLNFVYCISLDGQNYLKKEYPASANKIKLARLGTAEHELNIYHSRKNGLKLVSCSNVVPVKRIDRIIEALSKIDINIEWTHIGGGALFDELVEMAKQKLPKNVTFSFVGRKTQEELFDIYRDNEFHIFLNVSESEGLPVSIMEAMSLGLPVVCTDVGGSSEILKDHYNGYLLEANYDDSDLIARILNVANLGEEDYIDLRKHARKTWVESYSQSENYKNFANEIIKLINKNQSNLKNLK